MKFLFISLRRSHATIVLVWVYRFLTLHWYSIKILSLAVLWFERIGQQPLDCYHAAFYLVFPSTNDFADWLPTTLHFHLNKWIHLFHKYHRTAAVVFIKKREHSQNSILKRCRRYTFCFCYFSYLLDHAMPSSSVLCVTSDSFVLFSLNSVRTMKEHRALHHLRELICWTISKDYQTRIR